MNRWRDWWAQAERDLRHAEHSQEAGDYEWSAFAAHQAAEKAVPESCTQPKKGKPPLSRHGNSSSSAGAVYLNREARIEELAQAARRAAERLPAIQRVLLFGSLVSGIPTPRSDADLVVEVASSPHSQPRDRVPEVLRALGDVPCPVDLHVYAADELANLAQSGDPLVTTVLNQGRDLLLEGSHTRQR